MTKNKCSEKIKQESDLSVVPCPGTPTAKGCPLKEEHILKFPTGFCQNGRCEGTKILGPRTGKPQPTCSWWKRCPCHCHVMLDQMFTMTEQERHLIDNSGYSVDRGDFVMPTPEERIALAALSTPTAPDAPRYIESPAPDVVPPTVARSYTPTPTGRSARGELEQYVFTVVSAWAIDKDFYQGVLCTPKMIAEEVARDQGIPVPSTGAVDAVLKRWEAIGFCVVEKKPTRFERFTEDGVKLGLEALKERAKRAAKSKALLR